MAKIVVLDDYQGRAAEFADWARLGAELTFYREGMSGAALVSALRAADVVVVTRERTPLPKDVISELDNLRLIVTVGMANASIDMASATERGVVVCGTQSSGTGTTEVAWALILAAKKHLIAEDQAMRSGKWQLKVASDLAGHRLGLLGLGRLGTAMVPVAEAFGMDVVAWSQNLTTERAQQAGATYVTKDELLATSSVISIHLRLSERTRALIGKAEIAAMQPGTLLINTSRGPIVDEAALLEGLRSGHISAGLDVYDEEPLPNGHPLLGLDNVVLSPHLGYASEDNFRVAYSEAVEDIEAFFKDAPVRVLNA